MFDLDKSPIRKNIKTLGDGKLSIFEDEDLYKYSDSDNIKQFQASVILKDIYYMLETMEQNKDSKLKIAVMGEVKAGKSTFINACVGKKVAYTDVLEATAIVSEICYSENEFARIIDKQGNIVMDCSIEYLIDWIEEKTENMESFSEYAKIEIGIYNELLKELILVDTPGLLSITSENHDITNDYIAQTDYVLWVINSRNLGSEAVNDFIEKINLTGKPLIGIINKVDTENELLEISEFVKKEYSATFQEIFYISAENAWNAKDEIQEKKSGIKEVVEYLEDLTHDKEYSSERTQYFQLQREREVHSKMHSILSARKRYYDNELAQFAKINNEIRKVMLQELNHWLNAELYIEEKAKLLNADGENFNTLFQRYSGPIYLTNIIDEKYQEMSNFIFEKWNLVVNSLAVNSNQVLIDFKYDINYDAQTLDSNNELRAESTKKGLKNGTVLGLAFAGYSAWLGPAAATVTFTATLIPFVLPLAVGGAILGNLYGINTADIEKNAKKKQEIVENFYQEVLKTAKMQMEEIKQSLYACTDHYYEERCKDYNEKVFDFTEPKYSEFMMELDLYINELSDEINKIDNQPIIEPPKMEGLFDN